MKRIYVVFVIAVLFAIAGAFYAKHAERARWLAGNVRGDNAARMTQLYHYLSRAAVDAPEIFARELGTGMVVEAPALPPGILTNLPYEMTPQEVDWDLKDTWKHPFHLRFLRAPAPSAEIWPKYNLTILSSGPNGIDENGKGDDISISNLVIQVPF